MEREWYDNEFEKFLQDEVQQHKMYPSDKIWRNIHKELHGEKSWPALTFVAILLILALTISTLVNRHTWTPLAQKAPDTHTATTQTNKQAPAVDYSEQMSAQQLNERTFAAIRQKQQPKAFADSSLNSTNSLVIIANNTVDLLPALVQQDIVLDDKLTTTATAAIRRESSSTDKHTATTINAETAATANAGSDAISRHLQASIVNLPFTQYQKDVQVAALSNSKAKASASNVYEKPIVVLANRGYSRFAIQGYITPSMSYRRLADDKQRNNFVETPNTPPAINTNTNVNDVVRHKPAMGLEAGVTLSYSISKKLKVKSGVQFNVRQYYIDAYRGSTGMADIAVVTNTGLDTVRQYTSFANNGGYREATLDNKLYQVSVPLGLQWDVVKGKRLGISIEGTIQPTFTLNKNLYIISTDFKFYTDGTPFFRTWNINSSAGINLTYRVGKSTWYIGPQFRYQHLPTYSDAYPIKEFRYDYGLKMGFSTPL